MATSESRPVRKSSAAIVGLAATLALSGCSTANPNSGSNSLGESYTGPSNFVVSSIINGDTPEGKIKLSGCVAFVDDGVDALATLGTGYATTNEGTLLTGRNKVFDTGRFDYLPDLKVHDITPEDVDTRMSSVKDEITTSGGFTEFHMVCGKAVLQNAVEASNLRGELVALQPGDVVSDNGLGTAGHNQLTVLGNISQAS